MGRRSSIESYPRYLSYLNQGDVWPSESNSSGFVRIAEMAPRYASSALQKLIRWSTTYQAYVALNMSSELDRAQRVRNSPLGEALGRRAQGLDAIPAPVEAPKQLNSLEFLQWLAPIIAANSDLGPDDIIAMSVKITQAVTDTWTLTPKSR